MDVSDESKRTKEQQQERQLNTSLRRRALVKGSAAALPAIFTLRSGAVFAVGSSTVRTVARCMDMAATRPEPAAISEVEDEWFRRQTVCRTLQPLDSNSEPSGEPFVVYLVPDTENWKNADKTQKWIDLQPGPNSTPLAQQQMQLQSDGVVGGPIANVTVSDTPCFVLVLVDAQGMEVGYAASPDGTGSPLITSCFMSIVTP